MNIVPVTERPNAAASRDDEPNTTTSPTQAIISPQLMSGT